MFYRKSTTLARVKAALVLPLATFCVLFYTFSCTPSAEKKASLNEDTVSNGSAKVTLIKDSAGNVIGTAATGGAAGVPPPPPPPPPPPAAVPGQTIAFQDPVFKVVEVMPGFPGGDEARVQFMAKNMRYPETAIENKTEGTVYVTFVIEKDGSVKDAKVIRGIGGDCDKEALRVVKSMPKWTPGQQDGKPVRVQFTMPLQFRLSNNDKLGLINTGKVG